VPSLAIFKRDGRYLYWKAAHGKSIYLGTEKTPKKDRITQVIKLLEEKVEADQTDLEMLKKLLEKKT